MFCICWYKNGYSLTNLKLMPGNNNSFIHIHGITERHAINIYQTRTHSTAHHCHLCKCIFKNV